jgi:methylated-DNA-[protein]-cysteine S-methyltransferase
VGDDQPMPPLPGTPGFVTGRPGPFAVAAIDAPWGPVQVAAGPDAVLAIAVLAPPEAFADDVARRSGRDRGTSIGRPFLDRAAEAIAAFLAGDPTRLAALPLDLADRGPWDANVLGAVRQLGWGELTSYGRLARSIGRPGAARAAGGAVGRNPIGLAIPCHRVIAGDGSLGGYGGDWFGSREAHLEIKRELLAREGIHLPAADRLA